MSEMRSLRTSFNYSVVFPAVIISFSAKPGIFINLCHSDEVVDPSPSIVIPGKVSLSMQQQQWQQPNA